MMAAVEMEYDRLKSREVELEHTIDRLYGQREVLLTAVRYVRGSIADLVSLAERGGQVGRADFWRDRLAVLDAAIARAEGRG